MAARAYRRRLSAPAGMTGVDRLQAEEFSKRLWTLLAERRLSQSAFARLVWGEKEDPKTGAKTAKGRDRISDYIAGKALPSPAMLSDMAKALNMTPEELAPDIATAAAVRETPEIQVTVAKGRPDLLHVQIDVLLPAELGAELMALLQRRLNKSP